MPSSPDNIKTRLDALKILTGNESSGEPEAKILALTILSQANNPHLSNDTDVYLADTYEPIYDAKAANEDIEDDD